MNESERTTYISKGQQDRVKVQENPKEQEEHTESHQTNTNLCKSKGV